MKEEPLILTCSTENGSIDFVIKSYSITEDRIYFKGTGVIREEGRKEKIISISFFRDKVSVKIEPLKKRIVIKTKKKECVIQHATANLIADLITLHKV